jgi:hypothetical protein
VALFPSPAEIAAQTIDALRLNIEGLRVLGYLNVVVWLIPGMFGAGHQLRAELAAALAAELPSLLGGTVHGRLLRAGVLVLLAAGRAGVLAFQRLAELALGIGFRATVVRCHVHRLTR